MRKILILVGLLVGCDGAGEAPAAAAEEEGPAYDISGTETVEGALQKTMEWWLSPETGDPFPTAVSHKRYMHREEILKTLEVAEVMQEGELATAFYRYSVGTNVCRDSRGFIKVDGHWLPAYLPRVSEYSPLKYSLHKPHEEFLLSVQEKHSEWDKDDCWWD